MILTINLGKFRLPPASWLLSKIVSQCVWAEAASVASEWRKREGSGPGPFSPLTALSLVACPCPLRHWVSCWCLMPKMVAGTSWCILSPDLERAWYHLLNLPLLPAHWGPATTPRLHTPPCELPASTRVSLHVVPWNFVTFHAAWDITMLGSGTQVLSCPPCGRGPRFTAEVADSAESIWQSGLLCFSPSLHLSTASLSSFPKRFCQKREG